METRDSPRNRHSISYPLKPLQYCFTQINRNMVNSCLLAHKTHDHTKTWSGLPFPALPMEQCGWLAPSNSRPAFLQRRVQCQCQDTCYQVPAGLSPTFASLSSILVGRDTRGGTLCAWPTHSQTVSHTAHWAVISEA